MDDCIFCKIINKEFQDSSIVYEDDVAIAFMDIQPVNEGHTLVVPKKHFVTLEDCDEETAKHLMAVTKKLNSSVLKSVKAEGVLNLIANGEDAGQEIFHLHIHIVPRFKNDGFELRFPDGYETIKEQKVLDITAEKIKKEIK
jgi:histidine triad (HIT) family protein